MREREPKYVRDVREVLDGVDAWHFDRPPESRLNFAQIAFPIYKVVLDQDLRVSWTLGELEDEALEMGLDEYYRRENIRSALNLMVIALEQRKLIEFLGDDVQDKAKRQFYLKRENKFSANQYAYELGLSAGIAEVDLLRFGDEAGRV